MTSNQFLALLIGIAVVIFTMTFVVIALLG